jgi:hypothetical protein
MKKTKGFRDVILVGLTVAAGAVSAAATMACNVAAEPREGVEAAGLSSLSAGYESMSAADKQKELFAAMSTGIYSASALPAFHVAGDDKLLDLVNRSPDYLAYMLQNSKDLDGPERMKLTHRRGVAGTVKFAPAANSGLSGILAEPSQGIVRLSLTVPVDEGNRTIFGGTKPGLNPSLSLKFFVSKKPSVDLVALHAFDGPVDDSANDTRNFFAPDLRTTFSPDFKTLPGRVLKGAITKHFAGDWFRIGLDRALTTQSSGQVVAKASNPHHFLFRAPAATRALVRKDSSNDFRIDLLSVRAGTVLYDVYAASAAVGAEGYREQLVGSVVLTSALIASDAVDRLHFKHEMPHLTRR